MTLICGRLCTKGEGKERLVRKRKRKRRREVNEQLAVSVSSRGTGQGWMGYGIASLEPARRASPVCSLRSRATQHIVTPVTPSLRIPPTYPPALEILYFQNNSIPFAKRLNRSHVIRSLIVTGWMKKSPSSSPRSLRSG